MMSYRNRQILKPMPIVQDQKDKKGIKTNLKYKKMDQDFFEQGEYQQANSTHPSTSHNQFQQDDNVWQQANQQVSAGQIETTHTLGSGNANSSNLVINYNSSSNIEVDDQVTLKIREQQQRIQQVLRQKANKEYEQKQARKQAGRAQIEQFLEKKEKELQERKMANQQHEQQLIQKARQLNQGAGWNKVFQNVNLKMGEHPNSKQVNRMRQAIINKREDDRNTQ